MSVSGTTDLGANIGSAPIDSGVESVNLLTGALTLVVGSAGTDFGIASSVTTMTINLPDASASSRGALTSGDWTTFNSKVSTSRTINTTSPLTGGGDLSADLTLAIPAATGSVNGYLVSTDWTTFNNKVATTRTISTTAPITGGGDLSANRTIAIPAATSLVNGYLTSADWSTFNGKQASGNYITALTGDVTGSGPGSTATTLAATSNATLVTLSGLTTASALVSVGTITTGTWSATTIALNKGGTGQTTKSAAYDALSPMSALGDTVYGGASGTGTALVGNTTTTKKFLTQTGNGSVSAAPGWNTLATSDLPSNSLISTISFSIDGAGSIVTTGLKGFTYIPYGCTINSVTMMADVSGSCVIDIWKVAYASFPPGVGNTITGGNPPTLSSAQKSQDTTLSGWTGTSISAGDTLAFNVNSASTVTRVNLVLKVTKT